MSFVSRSVLVVLALGAVATPVAAGQIARLGFNEFTEGFNTGVGQSAAPGSIKLETVEYSVGYLSSRATSRLTLEEPVEATILIEHDVLHGPWALGQKSMAYAYVTSQIRREDAKEGAASLAEMKFSMPIFDERVRLDVAAVPAADKEWEKLGGFVEVDRKAQKMVFMFDVVDLVMKDTPDGDGKVGSIHAEAHFEEHAGDQEWVRMNVRAERLEFSWPGQRQRGAALLEVAFERRRHDDMADYDALFKAEQLRAPTVDMERMAVDVTVENLPADLDKRIDWKSPDMGKLATLVGDIAKRSPALEVRELELKGQVPGQPRVDVNIKGRVELDADRLAAVAAASGPGAALEAVKADFELQVHESFVNSSFAQVQQMTTGQGGPDSRQIIDALIRSGYGSRRTGGYIHTKLSLRGSSDVRLNDLPFNQAAIAGRLQALGPDAFTDSVPASRDEDGQEYGTDYGRDSGGGDPQLEEMRRQMGLR